MQIYGTDSGETLVGSNESDIITGQLGSDYLIGLSGSDIFFARDGSPDALQGGSGNDTYHIDSNMDSIYEFIESSTNIELLRLTTAMQPISLYRNSVDLMTVRVQIPNTHDAEFFEFSLTLNNSGQWSIGSLRAFDQHSGTGVVLTSSDSVWEYAYQIGPTSTGPFDFAGLDHDDEDIVSIAFTLDGQNFADIPVGTVINGKNLSIEQVFSVLDHTQPTQQIGTVNLIHHFDATGLTVDHQHDFFQTSYLGASYSAMMPFSFGDTVTIGGVSYAIGRDGSYENMNAIASSAQVSSLSTGYILSLALPSGGPDINGNWANATGPEHFWFHDAAENGKFYVNWVSGAPIVAATSRHVAHYAVTTSAPSAGTALVQQESQGLDSAVAIKDFTLPTNVEILALEGAAITATGNDQHNVLVGSEIANRLIGRYGDDILHGMAGDDTLIGGAGNDLMYGETGQDMVDYLDAQSAITLNIATSLVSSVTEGADRIFGIEHVTGSNFNDVIIGDWQANTLIGGRGADALLGAEGDDLIIGGEVEANELYGGLGNDRYIVSAHDNVFENEDAGTDSIFTAFAAYTLPNHVEILKFLSDVAHTGTGNAADNILIGAGSVDNLNGGDGSDYLIGGAGNDVLDGGAGLDQLQGGLGDDNYIADSRNDSTLELSGEGSDSVRTAVTLYKLQANVENLVFTGDAIARTGVGNELNNGLTGTAGTDDFFGREGDDMFEGGSGNANSLFGGTGNDLYVIRATGDSIFEYTGEGDDTALAMLDSFVLPTQVENLVYGGNGAFTGIGSSANNRLVGGSHADFLDGKDGNDSLIGGGGADTLFGGAGADSFVYMTKSDGIDRIYDFQSGSDKILLDGSVFTHTGAAALVQGANPFAAGAGPQFLYNSSSGIVSFDEDGAGGAVAIVITQLNSGLTLTVSDFGFI
jgi:Ca2+-binding RTX toxin-like protein